MGKPNKNPYVPTEWAKHLRPWLKRQFHKKVRKLVKIKIKEENEGI